MPLDRVRIMAVLPLTTGTSAAEAPREAERLVAQGADIVELLPQPTLEMPTPGGPRRLRNLVKAVRAAVQLPLCVTADGPESAGAALDAGADMIRSQRFENPDLCRRVARFRAAAVVAAPPGFVSARLLPDAFEKPLSLLRESGAAHDTLIVSPGVDVDLRALQCIDRIAASLPPVALDVSHLAVTASLIDDREGDRDGSLALATWAVMKGVRIVRTTAVRAVARSCRMAAAVFDPDLVTRGAP